MSEQREIIAGAPRQHLVAHQLGHVHTAQARSRRVARATASFAGHMLTQRAQFGGGDLAMKARTISASTVQRRTPGGAPRRPRGSHKGTRAWLQLHQTVSRQLEQRLSHQRARSTPKRSASFCSASWCPARRVLDDGAGQARSDEAGGGVVHAPHDSGKRCFCRQFGVLSARVRSAPRDAARLLRGSPAASGPFHHYAEQGVCTSQCPAMTMPDPRQNPHGLLRHLYDVAVQSAQPLQGLQAHLPAPPEGRTLVLGGARPGAPWRRRWRRCGLPMHRSAAGRHPL